jgi:hypothetical protein
VRGGGGRFVRVRRVGGVELTPLHDAADARRARSGTTTTCSACASRSRCGQCCAQQRAIRAGDAVLLYDSTTLGPRQMPDPADDTKSVCMFSVQMIVTVLQPTALTSRRPPTLPSLASRGTGCRSAQSRR